MNVVKYKLDLMRKRMETEERDATSRASFKCPNCNKTFTDLEADQLFDFNTNEFRCTFCGSAVEEDLSALPKKDSRLMLAKFNEQLQTLYDLLREVEEIKLSPEILEPEPVDIDTIRGTNKQIMKLTADGQWSGDATRSMGFAVEEARVNVSIGSSDNNDLAATRKDRPVWMTESTVITNETDSNADDILDKAAQNSTIAMHSSNSNNQRNKKDDDIMSVLLQHEKQVGKSSNTNSAVRGLQNNNSSDSDEDPDQMDISQKINDPDVMDSESDEDDSPTVMVAGKPYPIDEINDSLISKMTHQEKDTYIQVYQEHFSHMYD